MYTQTASPDDHHTPTGWKRWAYSTNHKDIGTIFYMHNDVSWGMYLGLALVLYFHFLIMVLLE